MRAEKVMNKRLQIFCYLIIISRRRCSLLASESLIPCVVRLQCSVKNSFASLYTSQSRWKQKHCYCERCFLRIFFCLFLVPVNASSINVYSVFIIGRRVTASGRPEFGHSSSWLPALLPWFFDFLDCCVRVTGHNSRLVVIVRLLLQQCSSFLSSTEFCLTRLHFLICIQCRSMYRTCAWPLSCFHFCSLLFVYVQIFFSR